MHPERQKNISPGDQKRPGRIAPPAGWDSIAGTLARELCMHGRGLHTGRRVTVRILPMQPGAARRGIVFRRVKSGQILAELPVRPDLWRKHPLCSTLQAENGAQVRTVEHLLAALLMSEIDEAVVELDAEELPIFDGGAERWIAAIKGCGRVPLTRRKRFIRLLRPFAMEFPEAKSRYVIDPASVYAVSCSCKSAGFPRMRWTGRLTPASFAREVAPARSYGAVKWAIPAIVSGLVAGTPILRGASFSSVAAIWGNRVIGGMRFPNEFARHRVLDLVGDFALAGAPLLGKITVIRPTHERNQKVISALLAAEDAWEWAEFGDNLENSAGKKP